MAATYYDDQEEFNKDQEAERARLGGLHVFKSGTGYDNQEAYDTAFKAAMEGYDPDDTEAYGKAEADWKASNFVKEAGKTYYGSQEEADAAVKTGMDAWTATHKFGAPPAPSDEQPPPTAEGGKTGVTPVVAGNNLAGNGQGADPEQITLASQLKLYNTLLERAQNRGYKISDLTPMSGPLPAGAAARAREMERRQANMFTSADAAQLYALSRQFGNDALADTLAKQQPRLKWDENREDHAEWANRSNRKTVENERLRREVKAWGGVENYKKAKELSEFYQENKEHWADWLKMAGTTPDAFRKMSASDKLKFGQRIKEFASLDQADLVKRGVRFSVPGFVNEPGTRISRGSDLTEEFAASPEMEWARGATYLDDEGLGASAPNIPEGTVPPNAVFDSGNAQLMEKINDAHREFSDRVRKESLRKAWQEAFPEWQPKKS